MEESVVGAGMLYLICGISSATGANRVMWLFIFFCSVQMRHDLILQASRLICCWLNDWLYLLALNIYTGMTDTDPMAIAEMTGVTTTAMAVTTIVDPTIDMTTATNADTEIVVTMATEDTTEIFFLLSTVVRLAKNSNMQLPLTLFSSFNVCVTKALYYS